MNKNKAVVAVDFFCGAGGMTRGLIDAGIHVLAGVDNEPLCRETYLQNKNKNGARPEFLCLNVFRRSHVHPDGQQHLIARELRKLLSQYKKTLGSYRLVFAICAPCQPFTTITRIKMLERRKFKRENDANLLLTMLTLIKDIRPDAIICENVEGIIGDEKGSVIGQFKGSLKRAGYDFDADLVKTWKFGVPQYRTRTIGLGIDRRRHKRAIIEVPESDPRAPTKTVHQVIGHLPPLAAGERHATIPNHHARNLNDLNLKRISCAKPGETNGYLKDTPYGNLSLNCHKRLVKKWGVPSFSDTYTRMRGDDFAPTITTHCISITNGRFGHYDVAQNRGITPREAALLQTFPQTYVFHPESNISFAATLIGNAVPPRLARFFGSYLTKQLAGTP